MTTTATTHRDSKTMRKPSLPEAIMGHSIHAFISSRPTAILLVALAATWAGCTLDPSPYDEQALVALFPADGAAAVPTDGVLRIDTGWGLDEDATVTATLTDEQGQAAPLSCVRDEDDTLWIECTPEQPLQPATRYTFTAESGNALSASTFTTEVPTGNGYEIGESMVVEQLGSDSTAATVLTRQLADGGAFLMATWAQADGSEQWFMGPGQELPDGAIADYAVKAEVGYPVAMDVQTDARGFDGQADHAYLPVSIDGQWRYVRLDEVTITGTWAPDSDAIGDLEVEALVTSTSIMRLASYFDEEIADLLVALCRPDVDTDGDGQDDAVMLRLTAAGTPTDVH